MCGVTPAASECTTRTYVLAEGATEDHVVLRLGNRLWGIEFAHVGEAVLPSIEELDARRFEAAVEAFSSLEGIEGLWRSVQAEEGRLGRELTEGEREAIIDRLRSDAGR